MNPKLILLVINIISWGIFGVINKIALQRLHPLQLLIVGACVSILTLPLYSIVLKHSNITVPHFTTTSFLLCIAASSTSIIGNIAYIYGIRSGQLGTVAVLSSTYPVLTVGLAVLFLGETLTITKILGIIFVMVGVVILGR
jgi:transporter family protein